MTPVICTPLAIYRQRLMDVVRALRDASKNDALRYKFTMGLYAHPCGTPACAMGHYAARSDLQNKFVLSKGGNLLFASNDDLVWHNGEFCRYFNINQYDAEELFSARGCGFAKTPLQAARYIEGFVAHKYPQWRA